MFKVQPPQLLRYSVSVFSVLLALLLGLLLGSQLKQEVSLLFFAAVVFSSWYGGLASGLVSTVLTILVNDYFFTQPFDLLAIASRADRLELIVFSSVALLMSSLNTEQQTAKERTELKQVEKILAQEQANRDLERQRLRSVLNILPIGVLISDAKGRLLEINPAVKAIWGADAPLLDDASQYHKYKGWWASTGKPVAAKEWALARTLATGKAVISEEIDIETFDGQRKTILNSAVPIRDHTGAVVNAVAVNVDITARKVAEEALRQSEAIAKARAEELETIMETVPAAVWIAHDPQCHHMTVNRTAYKLMRLSPGSVMTATPASGEYPFPFKIQKNGQDIPLDELAMQQASRTGQEVEAEFEFVFSEDDVRSIYGKAVPLREPDGAVRGVVGAFLDVTEHKQAEAERQQIEAALRQKQEWLDLAQTAAKLGSFDWNMQTNVNLWSKELEAIYGLQPGEFGGTCEDWARWAHPDDLPKIQAEFSHSLTIGTSEFFADFRIIRRDGSIRWLQTRARILYDDGGQPWRLVGVNVDITDSKQIEIALQNSEARFRHIVESNILGVFFGNMSGNITEANDAFLQMVGYTQQDLLEGKLHWLDMTPLEQVERTQQAAEELRKYGVCAPFEKEFFRKDGSRVSVLIAAALFKDSPEYGFSCVIDMTARKQAEAERDRSELMFRTLADTMPQMFWITNPDGYHEYFNQRWYEYTGTTLEQTQGEGWQHILHPDDVQRTIEVWQNSLQTGKTYEIEYRLRCVSNGEYRWHLARAFPLRDRDGQIVQWFGSCTDIQDQKLAIEERAQALERERAARIELEKVNRMKDDFLAIVSHELRSPLNPILGWSQLLKCRKLDAAKTTQALEIIERNAKLQARLIDDLLDVSRILRGKLSLNVSAVDLVATIEAAVETVRLAAEAKSIQIQTQFASAVSTLEGDPNRLQQVVWNLLTNAVKFTPAGGRVEIRLEQVGSFAQMTVTDTGKGISPDFLPHVFDRFRQADDATTRTYGGLGLGLAIVRNLVELHSGSVQVTSLGEGLGATFTVTLPLLTTGVSQTSDDYQLPQRSLDLKGLRIVVVDDNVDTLNLLAFILEQYGVEVKAVASASEALEAIAQTQPDLLLSDIAMPEMNGYMLIRQVRALEGASGRTLPAIALTAFAAETDHNKIISAGFQTHLTKPVEPAELALAIANLCRRNSQPLSPESLRTRCA